MILLLCGTIYSSSVTSAVFTDDNVTSGTIAVFTDDIINSRTFTSDTVASGTLLMILLIVYLY